MNDEFEDIVAELRRLDPSKPSRRLTTRLELELGAERKSPLNVLRLPTWRLWAPLAAAGVAILLAISPGVLERSVPPTTSSIPATAVSPPTGARMAAPGLHRVNTQKYLVDAADDGVIYASSSLPLRKVRWRYVSASQWKDQENDATVEVIVPGETTVFIPMRVH